MSRVERAGSNGNYESSVKLRRTKLPFSKVTVIPPDDRPPAIFYLPCFYIAEITFTWSETLPIGYSRKYIHY